MGERYEPARAIVAQAYVAAEPDIEVYNALRVVGERGSATRDARLVSRFTRINDSGLRALAYHSLVGRWGVVEYLGAMVQLAEVSEDVEYPGDTESPFYARRDIAHGLVRLSKNREQSLRQAAVAALAHLARTAESRQDAAAVRAWRYSLARALSLSAGGRDVLTVDAAAVVDDARIDHLASEWTLLAEQFPAPSGPLVDVLQPEDDEL